SRYPDARGDGHRRALASRGERVDRILQLLNGAVSDAEEALAFGGEADRTIAAVDEPRPQRGLERDDLAADGGLGDEKIPGGARHAHAPADRDEAANEVERGQANRKSLHVISSCGECSLLPDRLLSVNQIAFPQARAAGLAEPGGPQQQSMNACDRCREVV